MVVSSRPSACAASSVHDLTDSPSSSTVQAPQLDVSHPTFVPVSPRVSRRKYTRSVRGSTSAARIAPLTVTETCVMGASFCSPAAFLGRASRSVDPSSGAVESRRAPVEEGYRGGGGLSAADPVHSDPDPWVTPPAPGTRAQRHRPLGAWTAAAQVSAVAATETISGVVEGPSTKM